ncbi:MAG: ATP-binding protein [Pirellulales bacterium]|nr:ATP-binding protein [Pirellulales bacterium]
MIIEQFGRQLVPSLYVIQGNGQGSHFDLAQLISSSNGHAIGIGREKGNDIAVEDHEASRRHAEIRKHNDTFVLTDLDSSNGTFLNNGRISEAELKSGDRIQIGRTLFLYSQGENGHLPSANVEIVGTESGNDGSRIIAAVPDKLGPDLPPLPQDDTQNHWLVQAQNNLDVMYRTALAASHTLDIDDLLDRILHLVFDWVEADRGCIMLREEETGQLITKARRDREAGTKSSMTISRTILDYVLERHEGVLTSNAQGDDRFRSGQSVLRTGVHEAICVPMQGRYGQIGVLYVDTLTPLGEAMASGGQRFSDEHLKLMVAIGHQAALAVEDTTYYSAMVQSERLAAVGQTIATLSHHIKNILQGIHGGSYLVEMGLDKNDLGITDKGWGIVRRNQHKISSLVMDMLSFSKDRKPEPIPSDIPALLADIVETVKQRAEDGGISVHCKTPDNFPVLLCDAEALSRAILNVVTNAIDAVEEQSNGTVDITTELDEKREVVQVRVTDNGPGIPAETLPDIFNLFVSTKGAKGTGLGLTVSQKILREHGGDISVESSATHGTCFTLSFPLLFSEQTATGNRGTVTDVPLPSDFDASITP